MKSIFTVYNISIIFKSTHEDHALSTEKSLMDVLMPRILFPVITGKKKVVLTHAMHSIL